MKSIRCMGTGVKQSTSMTSATSASTLTAGAERLVFVQHARMTRPEEEEHRQHHQRHHDPAHEIDDITMAPATVASEMRATPRRAMHSESGRRPADRTASRFQRRRQHAEPRGEHHRVDVQRVAIGDRAEDSQVAPAGTAAARRASSRAMLRRRRHDGRQAACRRRAAGTSDDEAGDRARRCRCRTAPSRRERLADLDDRAQRARQIEGNGMKKGSVASTS